LKRDKKITLIVHDLSANPVVRAYPIGLALERMGYEIEVAGFLIEKNKVYEPYKDKFLYKTVDISNGGMLSYLVGLSKLLQIIEGDIIYAFKPRMTSYFVGLLKSYLGIKKLLILDAEDDELYFNYANGISFLYYFILRGWNSPNSHGKLLLLHLCLFPAKKRTVVSSKLQMRYGGKLILHGPDEQVFNPDIYDTLSAKKEFNLPLDKKLILFAGVPHNHKGLGLIVSALEAIDCDRFALVCAGPSEHNSFLEAKKKLGSRCVLLGMIDNSKMARLLSAVDITPMIQRKTKFTESQMPAKLFEAMAMEKLIIATDVSDIGIVLGKHENKKRGLLIDFDSIDQLIIALKVSIDNPTLVDRIRKNAREYYLTEASVTSNVIKLREIFD
jgi:glycosyltransferase involved in cell wall biosynthesis